MPRGTTAEHIIMFVIHVAAMKNELHQVVPLVGALAGASRLVHSHTVVPMGLRPLVATMYPDVARMLGFPEYIREASLNTVVQGQSDEVSLHVCSSYLSTRMLMVPRIRPHLRPARANSHQILWPVRTGPKKNKRTRPRPPSPRVNEGSQRRTCTAALAPAWSRSKTHTHVRSTASATLSRVGAAQGRA